MDVVHLKTSKLYTQMSWKSQERHLKIKCIYIYIFKRRFTAPAGAGAHQHVCLEKRKIESRLEKRNLQEERVSPWIHIQLKDRMFRSKQDKQYSHYDLKTETKFF